MLMMDISLDPRSLRILSFFLFIFSCPHLKCTFPFPAILMLSRSETEEQTLEPVPLSNIRNGSHLVHNVTAYSTRSLHPSTCVARHQVASLISGANDHLMRGAMDH